MNHALLKIRITTEMYTLWTYKFTLFMRIFNDCQNVSTNLHVFISFILLFLKVLLYNVGCQLKSFSTVCNDYPFILQYCHQVWVKACYLLMRGVSKFLTVFITVELWLLIKIILTNQSASHWIYQMYLFFNRTIPLYSP